MTQYTITEVLGLRPWATNDGNNFIDYTLQLAEEEKQVRLTQKPDTPPPVVGATMELDLTDFKQEQIDRYAPLAAMKKATKPKTFGGGGGFGGGPRQEDPKRNAEIKRQHSQEMAIRALDMAFQLGVAERPDSDAAFRGLIRRWADFFDADAKQVRDAAG